MKNNYTKSEKLKIIEKYQASDLNKTKFCKENGITAETLRTWIKKIENTKTEVKFIEIELKQEENSIMEVKINEFSVKIDKNTDFKVLENVLKLVKSI